MVIKEDIFFSIHWLKIYSGFSFQRFDLVIRDKTNMLRLKKPWMHLNIIYSDSDAVEEAPLMDSYFLCTDHCFS